MGVGAQITGGRAPRGFGRRRHVAICLLAVTSLAVTALAVQTVSSVSAAAAGAPGSWQLDKSYAQTPQTLSAISCPTTSECIAVGVVFSAEDVIEATTNGGATWTAQHAPSGAGVLYGISCPSALDCMIVGSTSTQGGAPIDIVTTNGGATWTLKTIPGVLHQLYAVSCPSTTMCTAVDGGAALTTGNFGASWSLVGGLPADNESLDSISCPSTSTCVAGGTTSLGGSCRPFPSCGTAAFYTWTTDGGATWSEVGAGSGSGGISAGTILSVSCATTTQCMIGGDTGGVLGSPVQGFAYGIVLSGSCTIVTGCGQEAGLSSMTQISGVSCPSISACVAVGDGQIATPTATGTSWTTQSAPIATVDAVACSSNANCMAAGAGAGGVSAVASSTNGGTSWATAFVAPYGVDDLDAVSCPSASVCTAGGTSDGGLLNGEPSGPGVVVNSTDGGATWTQQALPPGVTSLSAISCASTSVCEALGWTGTNTPAIVGTINGGATWKSQTVPSGFALGGQLSCPSALDCTAVSGGGGGLYGTRDGGSTWSPETTPAGVSPVSVSCPTATSCIAVGFDGASPAIVATSDGGTTWSSQTTPSGSFELLSVDCLSSTSCVAMGHIINQSYPVISTTDAGATWTMTGAIAESPSLYQLNQLACTSVTACSAVGMATPNDGPGIVEATANGGATWVGERAPSASLEYKAISCPAAGACVAVGDGTYTSGAVIIGQAPTTSVTIPTNGATLSGTANLDSVASSPEGMGTVRYEISGGSLSDQVVATATPTIYGWLAAWNTTTVPNGTYNLQSVAADADGTTVTSGPVSVTVANAPPSTAVLVPSNGATQSGVTQYLDAGASTNVTSVSFELSGGSLSDQVVAKATPTIYGWLAAWNTTTVPNGTYSLQSVAAYAGGVKGTSAPISLTVNNPPPTTSVLIPPTGAKQSGSSALLDATASSNVATVSFELSGGSISGEQLIAKGTLTQYGWLAQWNTTSVPDGTYSLASVAAYASGVGTTSAPITITVNN